MMSLLGNIVENKNSHLRTPKINMKMHDRLGSRSLPSLSCSRRRTCRCRSSLEYLKLSMNDPLYHPRIVPRTEDWKHDLSTWLQACNLHDPGSASPSRTNHHQRVRGRRLKPHRASNFQDKRISLALISQLGPTKTRTRRTRRTRGGSKTCMFSYGQYLKYI